MTYIYIASDHAGAALKAQIGDYVQRSFPEYIVVDLGTNDATISVDYPDYGFIVARKVATDKVAKGIVICGSGIGMSIAANRVAGVRAALCMNADMAQLSREHNDANMLALGARMIDTPTAFACVDAFLTTAFAGGRHTHRVEKLA
jgi:ribose 5-phosphate isomerase B